MPTNLYGPGDNFDLDASHVVPALLRKMHEAKAAGAASVPIWGTGTPRREFLHVDDLADACVFLLRHYSDEAPINVGCGEDLTIAELAGLVREVVGFAGELALRPDQARRHAAQAARRLPADGPGLAARIPPARGPRRDLRLVRGARRPCPRHRHGAAA